MKKQINIEETKRLLDAYYNGTTSVAEEQLLREFFSENENIPPEMEADRQLFLGIDKEIGFEVEVPFDLEARLVQHIDKLADAESHKRHWVTQFKRLSIAASVAILLATGVYVVLNSGNDTTNEKTITIAENLDSSIINEEIAKVETIDTTTVKESNPQVKGQTEAQVPTKVKTNKKRAKRKRVIPANQLKTMSEEYIAYENTERALLILSQNLNKAKEGVNKTKTTINEVNNTIIDII